ncbi:hypothetical protein AHAS_Ahas03G0045600 [Arachis hypogaea]
MRRFVIPVCYLNQPSFQELLNQSEEEFGYDHPTGGLTIPCSEDAFLNLTCQLSGQVWVYWGAGERKKSMCCNNFHIVIFSGCHLTTAVVFSPPSLISLVAVVVAGRQCDSVRVQFGKGSG